MDTIIHFLKEIGPLLGYIATGIALFVTIKTGLLKTSKKYIEEASGKEESDEIHHALDARVTAMEDALKQFLENDAQFKDKVNSYLENQSLVDKKLMANIIEGLYYSNRDKKTLDRNELQRLTEVYAIYSNPIIHGNSYISALYNVMIDEWELVD